MAQHEVALLGTAHDPDDGGSSCQIGPARRFGWAVPGPGGATSPIPRRRIPGASGSQKRQEKSIPRLADANPCLSSARRTARSRRRGREQASRGRVGPLPLPSGAWSGCASRCRGPVLRPPENRRVAGLPEGLRAPHPPGDLVPQKANGRSNGRARSRPLAPLVSRTSSVRGAERPQASRKRSSADQAWRRAFRNKRTNNKSDRTGF